MKAPQSPQPGVKYHSRALRVCAGCLELPAGGGGGGGLGPGTPRYFSILLLLLAGCWLPRWELFVGLKPRSARDMANPSCARNHLFRAFSPSESSVFSFLSPGSAGKGRQPASWWGWRCQLHGERQEFSSPWANSALQTGWLPFAHLCGFQPLGGAAGLTPAVPGYHSHRGDCGLFPL